MVRRIETAAMLNLILAGIVEAATITVGLDVGHDYHTIQAAIDATRNGDTIVVAEGKYEETIHFGGKNIVLRSADPNHPAKPILEPAERHLPVVVFTGRERPECVLNGFAIEKGHGRDAGGIRGNGTKATILNCRITDNRSYSTGGGLSNCDGMIQDCIIVDNYATGLEGDAWGGGLYDCDGTIVNCTISENRSGNDERIGRGGGLHSCDGTITNCSIGRNQASGNGAGLYDCDGVITDCHIGENSAGDTHTLSNGGGLYGCDGTISDCTIVSNIAWGDGGGLCECRAVVSGCAMRYNRSIESHGGAAARCESITECAIKGNWARGYGGGLFKCEMISHCSISENATEIHAGGGLSQCDAISHSIIANNHAATSGGGLDQCKLVANCIVSGNRASVNGGGLHECDEVLHCTIVGNHANGKGSAVYYSGSSGIINSTIIWDNWPACNGHVYVACFADALSDRDAWSLALTYNDIQGGRMSLFAEPDCAIQWGPDNLDLDPRFVRPGSWSEDRTWVPGDTRLLMSSPCVDAGDPTGDYSEQTDIDGEPRLWGQGVDIGADEYMGDRPFLVALTISGPNEVDACSSAQYRATAWYSDESAIDVTETAQWFVERGDSGSIDNKGLLTLPALTEGAEITVQAMYTDGSTTCDAHKLLWCHPLPPAVAYHVDGTNGSDENNGLTPDTAFATIQRSIDAAVDGDTILVHPGTYTGEVRFKGKAITLRSGADVAILQNPGDFAVSFYYGEGRGSILRNFVITNSSAGIFVAGSSPTISNVTVVANDVGIEAYAGAEPDIRNCIVWNNRESDLVGCVAQFSCLSKADAGPTNIDVDPLFANPGYWDPNGTPDDPDDDSWVDGDYHLRSEGGRWDSDTETWVRDDVTSPCIDAGDPDSPVGKEPFPNGGRINMGAYGGTPEASKSYRFRTFAERVQDLLATIEGQSEEEPLMYIVQGYLHFIMPPPGTHFAVHPDYRSTPEEAANWFLQQWRDLFVNESNAVSFEVSRVKDDTSRSTVRYRQKYAGLEVYAAEMIIDVGHSTGVEAVISDIQGDTLALDTGTVSLTPSLDAAAAQNKAIAFFAERYEGATLEASSPVLMVYAPSVIGKSGPIRVVWSMEVRSVSGPMVHQLALVDAHDGEVVFSFSLILIR